MMDAIGRLSLTVISVRLFPASDIARKSLSSSSDQRTFRNLGVDIIVASEANEAGPNIGYFKRTQLTFLSTAAGCQLKDGFERSRLLVRWFRPTWLQ
jgi:hypothetical protein